MLILDGNYSKVAAKACGVSEIAYLKWRQRGRKEGEGVYYLFDLAIKSCESLAETSAVSLLRDHMVRSPKTVTTFLERKFPERWGDKRKIELTGEGGGPLQVESSNVDLSGLPLQAKVEILQILERYANSSGEKLVGKDSTNVIDVDFVKYLESEVHGVHEVHEEGTVPIAPTLTLPKIAKMGVFSEEE
jgi:hypothetical protein